MARQSRMKGFLMSMLLNVRKYLTVDQLVVYAAVYEQVVQQGGTVADAVAELVREDPKRDHSSVRKVMDALNQRFNLIYGLPLLARKQDSDQWRSTQIGDHFYEFAKQTKLAGTALHTVLLAFERDDETLSLMSRTNLYQILGEVKRFAESAGFTNKMTVAPLRDEHYEAKLRQATSLTLVIDELFLRDKHVFDKSKYMYIPLPRQTIELAVPPSLLAKLPIANLPDGEKGIASEDIVMLDLAIQKTALGVRIGCAVADIAPNTNGYLNAENISELRKTFPKIRVIESEPSEFAMALLANKETCVFSIAAQTKQMSDLSGLNYVSVKIVRDSEPQYYNPCIIFDRSINSRDTATSTGILLSHLFRMKESNSSRAFHVSSVDEDLSRPSFSCPNCKHRITYDPDTAGGNVTLPCPHCLSVVTYSPGLDISSDNPIQIKVSAQVAFSPLIHEELFVCPTPNCGNEFERNIRKTTKDRDYVFCEACNTIYQSEDARPVIVARRCGNPNCELEHTFRVSRVRPEAEISCYNSMRHISYNYDTDKVKQGSKIVPLRYISEKPITSGMSFPCPNISCRDTRFKRVSSSRGQHFARCKNCGNDIHIVPARHDNES